MTLQKQVDKSSYDFSRYVSKDRWNSFYHQIDEIIKSEPQSILEIGVGPGITKRILKDVLQFRYESIDIDEELQPDHTGSVLDMPFENNQFDVIGCFQVLEHLPFENFEKALSELFRVANKAVIISLPDAKPIMCIHIPKLIRKKVFERPFAKLKQHVFDGQHYWEINKQGFEARKIRTIMEKQSAIHSFIFEKDYCAFENPYHHFFIFKKMQNC